MSNAPTEIANLLYTYTRLIDTGDYAGIGKLFEHARLTAEDSDMDVRGADAIAAHYARTTRLYPDTGTPKTKHVMSNPIIEIDEKTGAATCNAYYTVLQATGGFPSSPSSRAATRTSSNTSTDAGATRRKSSSSSSWAT